MVGKSLRSTVLVILCGVLAACAEAPPPRPDALAALIEANPSGEAMANPPDEGADAPTAFQSPEQCVPYAREHSNIAIYGDAYTWWDQAAGHFPRSAVPEAGTVMVLSGYSGPASGHVAVVRRVVSAREIRIDHANWLDDGSVYLNDPVTDVSAGNDWSVIRVWNIKNGNWGARTYPVKGFIAPADPEPKIAAAGDG